MEIAYTIGFDKHYMEQFNLTLDLYEGLLR